MLGNLSGECRVRPAQSGSTQRVLHLRLTPEVLEQLEKSQGKLDIAFDEAKGLRINKTIHPVIIAPEASTIEVYRCSRSRSSVLDMVGKVTHKVTMRRELGSSVSEKLKQRQAEEAAAKNERSVQALELGAKTKKGKPTLLETPVKATPQSNTPARMSPFLQARRSPLLVASSPKAGSATPKVRLVQALAISASSEQELSARLRISTDGLKTMLADVGIQTGEDWALKDTLYKEVKVWDWKHYTTAERSNVISRAAEAFDRLGLSRDDAARLRLIHPDKRNASDKQDTSPLALSEPAPVVEEKVTSMTSTSPNKQPPSRPQSPAVNPAIKKRNGLLSSGKVTKKTKQNTATKSKDGEGPKKAATKIIVSSPPTRCSTPSLESLAEVLNTASTRTSSLTSSSSDRSAASAASTTATSTSSEPRISKFLVTKRNNVLPSSRPVSRAPSPVNTPSSPSPKKRKSTEDLAPGPAKRTPTIDLQNMAREYKRLYPEYKSLHDAVSKKVDAELLEKFMTMHTQLSHYKATLHAEEPKQ